MAKSKQSVFSDNQSYRFNPDYIQTAVVKDNRDPDNSGKLKVWISGSQSNESSKESWITCRYVSIFAGRTGGEQNASTFQQMPKSYGFWAVPPDVGTTVCVFFANANIHDAYWFGGVFDDRMNTMVPGSATKPLSSSEQDSNVPITDYDRNTPDTDISDKYINVPLTEGLKKQNLLYDPDLGVPNRSSTRQTTPTVYGMSTPRQNTIIIDDGYLESETNAPSWDDDDGYQDTELNNPANDTTVGSRKNEGIVLRTRSGAQFLLSESKGNVFLINRDGTARIEMTPDGNINIHTDKSMNIRADEDINYTIMRDLNVEVGGKFNMHVVGDSKIEMNGKLDQKITGDVVFNVDANMRLYSAGELRMQSGAALNVTSGSDLNMTSTGTTNIKSSATNMTSSGTTSISGSQVNISSSGTNLSVGSNVSSSSEIKATDFQTASVGLNNHIHLHAAFSNASNHSNEMAPPINGGGSGNPAAATPAVQAQPANDVAPETPAKNKQEAVAFVTSTAPVQSILNQDLVNASLAESAGTSNVTYIQTYESLGFVMPCSGTIKQYGYWGSNVPAEDGSKTNRNGWIIQCNGPVVSPEKGTVFKVSDGGYVINHGNGFKSIFYDVNFSISAGMTVSKGQQIGTCSSVFYFEIRQQGAAVFGFSGTLDPGLFYSTVTGKGSACANKSLTAGQRSNPNAQPVASTDTSVDSTDLVTINTVQTIGSGYSQRGSLHVPNKTSATVKTKGKTVYSPVNENITIDKTVVGWKVFANDELLNSDLKGFEGLGNVINGRCYKYRDAYGYSIGYGHFIKPGEDYSAGITIAEAEQNLMADIGISITNAKKIYASYSLQTPYMAQLIITEMVYQMGYGNVLDFTNMLAALKQQNYQLASTEMLNSAWYGQTPRRATILASRMAKLQ